MILVTIQRSLWFAMQSFWRNIWLSLATIFIISLTFLSINSLVAINAISDSAIDAVKDKIDVSIYFNTDVRETKVAEIKSHLETLPQVEEILYVSPGDNLEDFKDRRIDDPVIQEVLKELEGNPLGATLIVKAKDLDDYPEVLKAIDNPAYADLIEKKSYDDHDTAIANINLITDNVRKGALIISLMFVIIAILIVFNTVRIAIFTHRQEVGIMKLVGASNAFVRSPFILENVFSGIIACGLSIGVIYLLLSTAQPHLANFFSGIDFNIIDYFNTNFVLIFGSQLVGIIALNVISSSLAIGRYLRV
jgi:cell division transport system permease protein